MKKDLIQVEGLCTKTQEKPLATFEVSNDLQHFGWKCDEYEYKHPRCRSQVLFAILLLLYIGMRPGEIVESQAWLGCNDGLLYRDLSLYRQIGEEYNGLVLHVKLRNRKGLRSFESAADILILREEPEERWLCPVSHFLGFGLADKVFMDDLSLTDILTRVPCDGNQSLEFKFKPEIMDIPVLRSLQADGTISPDKILTYSSLHNAILGLGQRAGYKQKLTAYCFRRGFGHAMNKNGSTDDRTRAMGHQDKGTYRYYAPTIINIDSQSLVRGRQPNQNFIEKNQSMMMHRNIYAPQPPGTLLAAISRQRQEQDDRVSMLQVPGHRQKEIRRQMRNKEYAKSRKIFFDTVGDAYELDDDTAKPKSHADEAEVGEKRAPSRYLEALLKHEPLRARAIQLMFRTSHASLSELVPVLRKLSECGNERVTYRGVKTASDGICPSCEKKINMYALHISFIGLG
ncbi:hypothetical protein DPSP01_013267 [Paraphaeosphaeria sporulosa]